MCKAQCTQIRKKFITLDLKNREICIADETEVYAGSGFWDRRILAFEINSKARDIAFIIAKYNNDLMRLCDISAIYGSHYLYGFGDSSLDSGLSYKDWLDEIEKIEIKIANEF